MNLLNHFYTLNVDESQVAKVSPEFSALDQVIEIRADNLEDKGLMPMQSVWIENYDNTGAFTLLIEDTGQRIVVPPGHAVSAPLFGQRNLRAMATLAGTGIVPLIFCTRPTTFVCL